MSSQKLSSSLSSHSILLDHLSALYGADVGRAALKRLHALLERHRPYLVPPHLTGLSERDSILITYGDQVQEPDIPPLRTLADFCEKHLTGVISGLHLLPFYPWTSDDGFSVTDYNAVNPALGDWEAVARLGHNFRLMFDAVINHISADSEWFRAFLRDDPKYLKYFITVAGHPDLSQVVRPRALPLLTKFQTPSGEQAVWTTFSDDQVDLNYHNPEVLLEVTDTLLSYVAHGAEFIRLDAIAFLWKEIGTPCLHLPQTHRVIQFFRAVLDEVAPHVMLITETNVPHADNVSYFGDGFNEAQLVYNFALPPLVLHTFRVGQVQVLAEWAASLTRPSDHTTFFNFLASHDGIGVNPARGILRPAEIDALVQQTLDHGGLVSYKHNPDGSQSPYELNINYFDALSNPSGREPLNTQVDRFIAAQAIMLSLAGVPGIYFHSLFGSRGWPAGVSQTGRNRTLNRQTCDQAALESELTRRGSLRISIFHRYERLLRARQASSAFHPHGAQRVVQMGEALLAVVRLSPDHLKQVLCLHNVSGRPQSVTIEDEVIFGLAPSDRWVMDLLTGRRFNLRRRRPLILRPYDVLWLTKPG